MEELEIIRNKIDEIDEKIQELFLKRMEWVRRVADIKKEKGMPISDQKRETSILEKRCGYFPDREFLPYYEEFMQMILKLSKTYQEDRMHRR